MGNKFYFVEFIAPLSLFFRKRTNGFFPTYINFIINLNNVDKIANKIRPIIHRDAYIVWGMRCDGELADDEVIVTMMTADTSA